MMGNNFFDNLTAKISESLPTGVKGLQNDFEENIKSILVSTFNKLELVTREEFDIQSKVLSKTRAKLEALEEQVNMLLKDIEDK